MGRARAGRGVAVGSVAALRASTGNAAYAATKGALVSYCRTLAIETARRGVTVNVIAPGFIDTDMMAPYAAHRAGMERQIPAGRFATPIAAGIALHHGEAAYGNVGSGSRLDFTVIGRDVNLASRIAKLNKSLGEPLLMSRPFVEYLWGDPEPLGEHVVEGFEERIGVYRPVRAGAALA